MKTIKILLILIFILSVAISCDDTGKVTNIDQIQGIWNWESTCGGLINSCGYPSNTMYVRIEFSNKGQYAEIHNDTIQLTETYAIRKIDTASGFLILKDIVSKGSFPDSIVNPILINDNELLVCRGELIDSFKKIK